MNRIKTLTRSLLLALACLLSVLALASCSDVTLWAELSDDSDADVLCQSLVDHVIKDEKDELYALVAHMVESDAFDAVWIDLRSVAEGAASADIHQTSWEFFTDGGKSYFQAMYMVEYDTGASMTLRITTGEDEGVLEGFGFTETTGFLANATATAKLWNTVLTVVSIVVLALTVWMIVDCVRRPLKRKPLWILLILLGISLTVTVGPNTSNLSFFVGILLQFSSSTVNMAIPAMITRVIIPVGPIIYLCLRKRMTLTPEPAVAIGDPTTPPEAGHVTESGDPVPKESGSNDSGSNDSESNDSESNDSYSL